MWERGCPHPQRTVVTLWWTLKYGACMCKVSLMADAGEDTRAPNDFSPTIFSNNLFQF